jgi:hypothetical protein
MLWVRIQFPFKLVIVVAVAAVVAVHCAHDPLSREGGANPCRKGQRSACRTQPSCLISVRLKWLHVMMDFNWMSRIVEDNQTHPVLALKLCEPQKNCKVLTDYNKRFQTMF